MSEAKISLKGEQGFHFNFEGNIICRQLFQFYDLQTPSPGRASQGRSDPDLCPSSILHNGLPLLINNPLEALSLRSFVDVLYGFPLLQHSCYTAMGPKYVEQTVLGILCNPCLSVHGRPSTQSPAEHQVPDIWLSFTSVPPQ